MWVVVVNSAIWGFLLITGVVLGVRAYHKRKLEDFEDRSN